MNVADLVGEEKGSLMGQEAADARAETRAFLATCFAGAEMWLGASGF